ANAEVELTLAEQVHATGNPRAREAQSSAQVAEEEARRDLERFARRDQRIVAAVALVDERARRARDLGRRLLHEPVAAVIRKPELAIDAEHAIEQPRGALTVRAVVRPDDREQPFEREVLAEVLVRSRVRLVLLEVRIETVHLVGGVANPGLDDLESDAL